jgi:hypothetical protein
MESEILKRNLISLAALALLALLAVGSVDSSSDSSKSKSNATTSQPSSPSTTATSERTPVSSSSRQLVHIGEVGILRAGDSNGDVVVGADQAANDQLTKMAVSHDQEGFAGMILSGRAFLVPAGTKVRMLDTIFTLGFLPTGAHVRILEGRFYGRDGVVPHEWVLPASAGTTESATPETRRAQPVKSATPSRKPSRKPSG